jgi:hypothetical protein
MLIITYLTDICWEIDKFVIKSDIFRRFFICKNILKKLSCYHDNYFRYFMFGKYNGFVCKARVSAWMYFLVNILDCERTNLKFNRFAKRFVVEFYVLDKTWAANLYVIFKLEPKARVRLSDTDRMRMFYRT